MGREGSREGDDTDTGGGTVCGLFDEFDKMLIFSMFRVFCLLASS
jgi:hypothetical protein